MKKRTTKKEIKRLAKNQIFVFGSNAEGNHAGGAAKLAHEKFGAKMGIGRGLTGQCYAIDTMSGMEVIKEQVNPFIAVAKSFPDNVYLLTEVGCGIAGFKPEEIAPLFEGAKEVDNIHLPESFWNVLNKPIAIKAYKAFNQDMTCRGFQFEVGKEYQHKGDINICNSGFHACENPLDTLNYYDLTTSKFAEVELSGDIKKENSDSKLAGRNIKIKASIDLPGFIKASVDFMFGSWFKEALQEAKNSTQNASSGDYTKNASSGDYTKNASSGDYTQNASSGDYTKNASSGDYTQNASSGDSTQNASSGHYTQNASSGHYTKNASSGDSTKNASSGDSTKNASSGHYTKNASSGHSTKNASSGDYTETEVNGKFGITADIGLRSKVKGVNGTLVCLAYYDKDNKPTGFVTGKIGEPGLEENTWYTCKGGKFVKC